LLVLLILPATVLADLEVHFLDVGQGDCAIILCDGEAMVIDGGPKSASDKVYSYIRDTLGLKFIDFVVSTHPHVDHVSGLAAVLNAAPVESIYSLVMNWESKAFRNMLKYAMKQGAQISVPKDLDYFHVGGAEVTILLCMPEMIKEGRTNDASIVLRIDYGETSFLFTGDAEEYAEYTLEDYYQSYLKADVLKVAHHGSEYSSNEKFLGLVRPEYAVISVGKKNRYGHPHQETLDRLNAVGAKILRTDELGTIVFRSDGSLLSLVQP